MNLEHKLLTPQEFINMDLTKIQLGDLKEFEKPGVHSRIPIIYEEDDKSFFRFVLQSYDCFSFGVSENHDFTTKKLSNYSLPLCLFSKDGETQEEKDWVDKFNLLCNRIAALMCEHKEAIHQPELELSDLRKLNPLFYSKDPKTKKIKEDATPTFYPKLLQRKDKDTGEITIKTKFYNGNDQPINPLDLQNKKFGRAIACIMIDSVYYGGVKNNLQCKVVECEYSTFESSTIKRLRQATNHSSSVVSIGSHPMMDEGKDDKEEETDYSDDDIEVPVRPKPTPVKTTKRVIKTTKKK